MSFPLGSASYAGTLGAMASKGLLLPLLVLLTNVYLGHGQITIP